MSTLDEFDIIFAGGGTSGCLIAGRLAAADPSLRILILEAGEHTKDISSHTQPARYLSHLAPTSTTLAFHVAKPSEHLAGRPLIVPVARCLGGGSSVNFAMYTRAAASDYDDWETVYGNSGWGSKDLIPLLRKTETYQGKPDAPTHGYSGPLKVSFGGAFTNVGKAFLDVAQKYDPARGMTDDINGLFSCNQYGRWEKWIDAETGVRSDVPHHFIYNQSHNQNLKVLTGARVKKVIFDATRAVGVEYVADKVLNPNADQTVRTARATRLIVVSAGAFGSPIILERSGIGASHILRAHGVHPLVDLPGVGQNYQDHNSVFIPCLAAEEAETLDAFWRGDKEEEERLVAQWKSDGTGLLAHNGLDAGIKFRPNAEELKELGPDFASRWETYFKNAPDKPVIWCGPSSGLFGAGADLSVVPPRKYFGVGSYTEYPLARGQVHISSAEDANAPPDFSSGFLSEPADVAVLRWGYKKSREIARRMNLYRGEYAPRRPKFAVGNDAHRQDEVPVDVGAPDIVYTEDDDAVIDAHSRENVQTTWHSLGTCAMKPRNEMGVVDERLNVYGVQGLKVAVSLTITSVDISIPPSNVAANTYSTALVIGEKAAVIIAQELGIPY
ncbi:GMC oxidoreductase-domain-containing protein [Mycena metata]|uniref:GMC oxidoreductase-domain-containing protein n=1 Tax=Mycena metata TaxID=1033252 RepID=A0AAD7N4P8_9AGAR|nr:GMC oxidoreductase-domain-containing protein [Mycena metata]